MTKKPDFIMTCELNSFAANTVKNRLPAIVRSVMDNNNFDNGIADRLECLLRDIPDGELKLLSASADVCRKINTEIRKHKYRWNNAPFIFVENYLYHLLKGICNYSNTKNDYFAFKKNDDVLSKKEFLIGVIDNFKNLARSDFDKSLKSVLHFNLFGNVADLSQIGISNDKSMNLLIDDTDKIKAVFNSSNQIDIVLDNSGEELLYDILFSHWILSKTKTTKVNLHFKTFPYFVSDAMKKDFYFLSEELSNHKTGKKFFDEINNHIAKGNLVLYEDDFWSDTNDFLSIPDRINNIFAESDLVVFKGDLNYRKLVEDRHWNYTTDTAELIRHINNNCLIIRVLKSEVITGLANIPDTPDNEWMYNGKCGIIQLVENGKSIHNAHP